MTLGARIGTLVFKLLGPADRGPAPAGSPLAADLRPTDDGDASDR
jgi:hypothetical protein